MCVALPPGFHGESRTDDRHRDIERNRCRASTTTSPRPSTRAQSWSRSTPRSSRRFQEGNPNGLYNAVLSGTEGGVTYLPTSRATVTVAGFPCLVASEAAARGWSRPCARRTRGSRCHRFRPHRRRHRATRPRVVTTTLDQLVSQLEDLAANGYVLERHSAAAKRHRRCRKLRRRRDAACGPDRRPNPEDDRRNLRDRRRGARHPRAIVLRRRLRPCRRHRPRNRRLQRRTTWLFIGER